MRTTLLVSVVFLLGFGGPLVEKTREGNELYREAKELEKQGQLGAATASYDEALAKYTDAQLEDPVSPILHFNIGDILYKQKKYDEAQVEFEKAFDVEDPLIQAKAHYNIGDCLFRQALQESSIDMAAAAIDSFQKALEIDPSDVDAKFNIEFIRKHIEQQEQEQEQQQGGQCQKDKGEQQKSDEESEGEQQEQESEERQEGEGEEQPQPEQGEGSQDETEVEQEQAAGEMEELSQEEITQEEAERILNALLAEEEEQQKELMKKRRVKGGGVAKDW